MKKIYKLLIAFVLCVTAFVLTACDGDAPFITVQNATAIREKVTIDFTIWDEEFILEEFVVTITGTVDGEDYEDVTRITPTGGKFATEEDVVEGEIELEDYIGQVESVSFSGLEIGETYSIVFTGTYNDRARKMSPTIDDGKSFDLSKLTTTGQGGTIEDAHEVSSTDDFEIIRNDPDGFFKLVNDIDCDNTAVSPFFTSSKKFVGDFNGNGYTIKNFKQDNYDQYLGLFGYIDNGGEVYDLNISDVSINSLRHSWAYIGGFAGYNAGEITNVNITDITISTSGASTGNQYVGGFVGYNKGNAIIDNCTVTNIEFDLNLPASARIGGFAATNERDGLNNPEITNCTVDGVLLDVQIENDMLYTTDSEIDIELSIGGFIGDNKSNIYNCEAKSVEILVYVEGTQTDIDNNISETETRTVSETERNSYIDSMNLRVGGFAGFNDNAIISGSKSSLSSLVIECAYLDTIRVGGFIGENGNFAVASDCSFTAPTTASITVSEDTKLSSSSRTINNTIGLNNSGIATSISTTSSISFSIYTREYIGLSTEGVRQYSFESFTF